MRKENQENWEKEFDENFELLGDEQYPLRAIPQKLKMEVKKFIRQVLEKEKERWKEENKKEMEELRDNLAYRFFGKPFNSLSIGESSTIIFLSESLELKKDKENSEQNEKRKEKIS